MKDVLLSIEDWTVRRDDREFGPLSLKIPAGTICTLMGPSGVGKTTLLKTILGFTESLAPSGTRVVNGVDLRHGTIPPRALYVPQSAPFNSNWEVESFLCRLKWKRERLIDVLFPRRTSRTARVHDVLSQLGLYDRRKATVAELSGGECQRAAVAQLLLLEPEIFVGDEFVSALDPGMATAVLQLSRDCLRERGGVGLLALHDVHGACRVSDQIVMCWPNQQLPPWYLTTSAERCTTDFVYTTLCLARWVSDGIQSLVLQHMVQALHEYYLQGEQYFSDWRNEELITTTPVNGVFESLPHTETRIDLDAVSPVSRRIEGVTHLGFSVPRIGLRPLELLVCSTESDA